MHGTAQLDVKSIHWQLNADSHILERISGFPCLSRFLSFFLGYFLAYFWAICTSISTKLYTKTEIAQGALSCDFDLQANHFKLKNKFRAISSHTDCKQTGG